LGRLGVGRSRCLIRAHTSGDHLSEHDRLKVVLRHSRDLRQQLVVVALGDETRELLVRGPQEFERVL
jgi:hypothetical protein